MTQVFFVTVWGRGLFDPARCAHLPGNDLRKLTPSDHLRVDNERPVPLSVRFLRTRHRFCANGCACQATDRDLERVSAVKKMNAWTCALLTTDRDPASVTPDKKKKSVITVFFRTSVLS